MFATVQSMLEKFGERELIQLTDTQEPYTDQINLIKMQAALDEANSEIEGYIAGRYSLPLQTIPPFLQSLACHMARYHACTGAMSDNDPIRTRYENAIKSLKEISKGAIALGGSPAGESEPLKTANNSVVMTIGRHDFGGKGW
ncbi:hypothetical protein B9T31_04150 [Acinetobacter sp. ANC 4558]|uniref:gp436 family protein n=1 Tax=Acinetobacter sp. ANC 4558 TaxID=1977876 RepID=UPI000A346ED7|nr:DUF1320 domain-containing protein [Acinetobacter sp. ANC 4558]OTG87697.1 hypothetical protein B9T31_04150 [Acinetobacter sp. ANC 4558]